MKKIGNGWQYTVYSLGNNRVRKIFNTRIQVYSILLWQCFLYFRYHPWKFPKYYQDLKEKAEISLSWIKTTKLNMSLFGNPQILNSTDYEQDEVVPIIRYLKNTTAERAKGVIDEFIKFNKFLRDNQVIDKSFNLGRNFEINKDGRIILIDIGELFIGAETVSNQVRLRPWDRIYVTSVIPRGLRKYFLEKMDENFLR